MIGVFDSGVGGLTILAAIRSQLPEADLIYVGDHAGAPYGERSLDQVASRSDTVAEWLIERGCQVVTIACNTASAAALHRLRDRHPDVVFVGMEPAVKPAASITRAGKVGVVATAATFQGELFASVVARFGNGVDIATAACGDWVRIVENGDLDGPETEQAVVSCLAPLMAHGIDVLVLACTHFPALTPAIRRVVGASVQIVDPTDAVARQTVRMSAAHDHGSSLLELYSTADTASLARAARRLGLEGDPALLPLDEHGSP